MSKRGPSLRTIIRQSFLLAEKTCTVPSILSYAKPLPHVSITFHDLLKILSAVGCILCSLITLFIICGHLFHWTNGNEQKQIVRIIAFLPTFGICSFFSVWFYQAAGYINPVAQYYEGFSMVALFLLYVTYITPQDETREEFFSNLERRWATGKKKGDKGSLRWFRIDCFLVFQIIPCRVITLIAAEVLKATSCPLSNTRKVGSIAIQVVSGVNTSITIWGVVLFERRLTSSLGQHRALLKLFAFKTIVGLEFIQSIMFTTLASERVYFPTEYVSYLDFTTGIPNFILCWEVFLYSSWFIKAYEYHPYRVAVQQGAPAQKSMSRALLEVLNPIDIIRALRFMFMGHLHFHTNDPGATATTHTPSVMEAPSAKQQDLEENEAGTTQEA